MNSSNTLPYMVFDGPGTLSDTINIFGSIKCSTFQCLILLLMPHVMKTYNEYFTFTSEQLTKFDNTHIYQNDNWVFNFPNKKCNKSLCISLLSADLPNQVNVTTMAVKYSKSHNSNCLYAGLTVGERVASIYEEKPTICESNRGSNELTFSLYSHNSSLIVIIYWFKPYSEINVSLVASLTKCKPVIINLCLLNLLCLTWKEIERCHSYLYNVTRFSNIDLNYKDIIHNLEYDSLTYKLSIGNCVILQFSSLPTEFHIVYPLYSQKLHQIMNKRYIPKQLKESFQHFCRTILIPKHAVDIHIKVTGNTKDINIFEQKVDLSKNNVLKNGSEPTIPRLNSQYKKWKSNTKDSSLELTLTKLATNALIDLVIHSVHRKSSKPFNLGKFALDFDLNNRSVLVNAQIPSEFQAGSSLFLLKWNAKSFHPKAYVSMQINFYDYDVIISPEHSIGSVKTGKEVYVMLLGDTTSGWPQHRE